jgi:hypothetical protein
MVSIKRSAMAAAPNPLEDGERRRLMAQPRPRKLPVVPLAEPARRHLPLAPDVRERDRHARPIYAVWEVTLACDLACRHCGSRAGRARPEELSTEACLDLVAQMQQLGVKEVTLIGGEAYLRDDWLQIVGAIREAGMTPTMTSGGQGIDKARAQAAKAAGLALVVGINQLHGVKAGRRKLPVSGSQLKSWGSALLSDSYPCAFLNWMYDDRYMARKDVKAAFSFLSGKARSKGNKSCVAK